MDNITLKDGFVGQKMIAFPKSIIDMVSKNPLTKSFYVTDLGYYPKANQHYRLRKKGAKQYIFIYCTKGKGAIRIGNQKMITLTPNKYYIIPKGTKHEYSADKEDPWSIYWFHINGSIVDELYHRFQQNHNFESIPFSNERLLAFEKIYSLFNSNYKEFEIEYANLLSLDFINSFIYSKLDFENRYEYMNSKINTVKSYLLSNLDKNFSLKEIADKFNYSASYLQASFKKETGYPIIIFFNLKKIQKACEYLNYTDMSIKEISFRMGFKDPLYFSRIFKKYMDSSPKNYKDNQRK